MKGKVVLVTGANGGLGTYVTQAFLDAGDAGKDVNGATIPVYGSDV